MAFEFTKENKAKFDDYCSRYPKKKATVLPGLWLIQEQTGWISPDAMEYLAELIGETPAFVYETATFYTQYNKKKIGKTHLQVCNSVCCWLRGSEETIHYLEKKLGIHCGESTADGKFHLSQVECLGSCGTAPMLQVNADDYYENLTEKDLDTLIEKLK